MAGGWLGAPAHAAGGKAKKPAASTAKLTFGPSLLQAPSVEVTMDPAGISVEYPVMARDLGAAGCPPPTLAAELARLGSPPLELGGVSQDQTAPPGALTPPPPSWQTATLYQLPAGFWGQLHCLLSSTREPLTVGLNMRTGNLAWATQIATEARPAAVNGLSYSLGNEPDLYELPNYSALDKPIAGEEAADASLYEQLAQYLRPAIGSEPARRPRTGDRLALAPAAAARDQGARIGDGGRAHVPAHHLPVGVGSHDQRAPVPARGRRAGAAVVGGARGSRPRPAGDHLRGQLRLLWRAAGRLEHPVGGGVGAALRDLGARAGLR